MIRPTFDPILHDVLADAGVAVLEARPDGRFTLLSRAPAWWTALIGENTVGEPVEIRRRFPFLDHFLFVAKDQWRHGAPGEAVESGIWIEMVGGEEVPLEATARRVESRSLLILRSPSARYEKTRAALQRARESLLANGVLERAVAERTEMIRAREEELAVRLVSAAEFRDSATGAHIKRIGRFTALVGGLLRVPGEILQHLELAAAMHDVGKIGIPDQILLKPGPLDSAERRIMERHTVMGARILEGSDTRALQLGREIALSHHERWDGRGYPNGVAGKDIPLVARIVAVTDFFDATVNDRPYRRAMELGAVLSLMESERGRHFDPAVLDAFLSIQPQIASIREEVERECAELDGPTVGAHLRKRSVPIEEPGAYRA